MADHPAADTPTFAHESELPRVPLPELRDSAERFLAWCAPLLDPTEYAETAASVEAFLHPDSPAHALHAALQDYNDTPGVHSWLDRFWPTRYLGRRDRIALNANFFFLFQDTGAGQIERAARLIAAATAYKRLLDDERIAPAMRRGTPQSMVQHKYLFSTTRIPGVGQDSVRSPYSAVTPGPSPARHILVLCGGHIFRMNVVGNDGRPYALADYADALSTVQAMATPAAPAHTRLGNLTTKARAEWAASRQALMQLDDANRAAFETIETALFCVCLDDAVPQTRLEACQRLLRGDGGNRWFDKALSLIVLGDGSAGINVEHCELDGTTVLAFVDALRQEPAETQLERVDAASQGAPAVEAVHFVLDDALHVDIRDAGAAYDAFAADNAATVLAFDDFGADHAKRLGVSPDAFVQLAYQLAHQRTKGFVGATYESIATRQYRHGRTEAMRVITPEMQAFVSAMENGNADDKTRRAALQAAATAHVERARACQNGGAPEQHLWELQLMQQRDGETLNAATPMALYDSPGWRIMRSDSLSTSSAPSPHIEYFGFGSTSNQCIGVGYVLLPDRLHVHLSAPLYVAHGMQAFAAALPAAIDDMRTLLDQAE